MLTSKQSPEEELHPKTFNSGFLQVSDIHQLWFAESGNPEGIPVVSLHGGPGSRSKPHHLNLYDLDKVRVIQFDQRGSGRSTPQGEIKENTTTHLISDIEKLRAYLEVDQWIVSGGSWGSTLGLLYAEKHPEQILGLFLTSIYLARSKDSKWLLQEGGASKVFPDLWEKKSLILAQADLDPKLLSKDLLEILESSDPIKRQAAIESIIAWEANLLPLENDFKFPSGEEITEENINSSRILLHYDANNYFIEDNQILDQIDRIKHLPTYILHGRYDMICLLEQSYLVHQALENSVLEIGNYDGHMISKETKKLQVYMFLELLNKVSKK